MGAISYVISLKANKAQRVLFPNPKRVSAIVFNNSAADAYLGYTSYVKTSGVLQGVPVKAGGGTWNTGEPECYRGEVWLISASSIDINVTEEAKEQ